MPAKLFNFGDDDLHYNLVVEPDTEARRLAAYEQRPFRNHFFASSGVCIVPISVEPLTEEDVASARKVENPFHELAKTTDPYAIPASNKPVDPQDKYGHQIQAAESNATKKNIFDSDTDSLLIQDENSAAESQLGGRFIDIPPPLALQPKSTTYLSEPLPTMSYVEFVRGAKRPKNIFLSEQDRYDHKITNASFSGDKANWDQFEDSASQFVVRLRTYSRSAHTFPYMDFEISTKWVVNGKVHSKISAFGFHADNIAATMKPMPARERSELRGLFQGLQGELMDDHLSHETTEAGIQFHGTGLHNRNLSAFADFGPHTEYIQHLAQMLQQGGKIYFVIPTAHDQEEFEQVKADIIAAKKQSFSPYADWLKGNLRKTIDEWGKSRFMPYEHRPNYILTPRVNYLNMREYTIVQGYAFVQEWELATDNKPRTYKQALCRLIHVPGAGGRELIALVQRNSEVAEYDLSPGDLVKVSIRTMNPNEDPKLVWSGAVIEPMAFSHVHDVPIRINRPYSLSSGQYLGPNPCEMKGLASLSQFQSGVHAMDVLDKTDIFEVDIDVEAEKKQFKKRVNTLTYLNEVIEWEKQQVGSSITEELTLANNFDRLPIVDLFEGVDEDTIEITRRNLLPSQFDAFMSLRTQRGGLSLIVGPPGSGKSFMLLQAVAVHLTSKTYAHPQALILSPLNHVLNKLALNAQKIATGRVVIRLQSSGTEEELLDFFAAQKRAKAGFPQHRPANIDPVLRENELKNARPAARMLDSAVRAQAKRYMVNDDRHTQENHEFSLAHHALVAVGIVEDESQPTLRAKAIKEGSKFGRFVNLYRVSESSELETEPKEKFTRCAKQLFQWILQNADIVCASMDRAADPEIFINLRPTMIVADEQAKAQPTETQVMNAHFPCCHHFVWIGDPLQTKPRVSSSSLHNGFSQQLSLSEFTRLLLAGFPSAYIQNQRRYCESINALVSTVFYGGEVTASPIPDANEVAQRFAELMEVKFLGKPSNVMLVDTGSAPEETVPFSSSKINKNSAAVIWLMVEKFVRDYGFDADNIAVLTPYTAQKFLHKQIQLQLASGEGMRTQAFTAKNSKATQSTVHLSQQCGRVKVDTWERMQGMENDIIFVDITASQTLGFVGQSNRLNTILSRARYGLILFADVQAMRFTNRFDGKPLGKVVGNLLRRGMKVAIDPQTLEFAKDRFLH